MLNSYNWRALHAEHGAHVWCVMVLGLYNYYVVIWWNICTHILPRDYIGWCVCSHLTVGVWMCRDMCVYECMPVGLPRILVQYINIV